MQYKKLKAVVRGTTCEGKPFEEKVSFELVPPKDNNHYGTGYYMVVKTAQEKYPNNPLIGYYDVRYKRTTDIEILADRYIKDFYGNNAKEVEKEFVEG